MVDPIFHVDMFRSSIVDSLSIFLVMWSPNCDQMMLPANLLKIHFLEFCQTNISMTGSQFS